MGMRVVVAGVVVGVLSAGACGQGFPVRSVSGVYDGAHPAFEGVYLPGGQGLGETWVVSAGGDLDGDGLRDLVVVFSSLDPVMTVFPGTLDGLGEPVQVGAFGDLSVEGEDVYDMSIADMNADGLLDVAVLTDEDVVRVVLNQGAGSYVGGSDIMLGTGNWFRCDVVDVDGDGALDVLVWEDGGEIGYVSDVASPGALISLGASGSTIGVRVGDLDGDGLGDVVTSESGGGLRWARREAGGFAPFGEVDVDLSNFVRDGVAGVVGDFDGDGMLDVVFTATDTGLRSLGFVTGPIVSGETREAVVFDVPASVVLPTSSNPISMNRPGIEALDLDGDGTEDLITAEVRITDPLNANGRFGLSREFELSGEYRFVRPFDPHDKSRAFIDLGSDGVLDRAALLLTSAHEPLTENGFGERFMVGAVHADIDDRERVLGGLDRIETTGGQRGVLASDLDLDGDDELVLALDENVRVVDRGIDGAMVYNQSTRFTVQSSTPRGDRVIEARLDSDARPDIVTLARDSGASFPAVYLNPVSGPFGVTTRNDPIEYNGSALAARGLSFVADRSFAVGDIDGDGDEDIVIRGDADDSMGFVGDAVLAWLNDGEGVFSDGALTPLVRRAVDGFNEMALSIGVGDFDGDGIDELVSAGVDGGGFWSVAYYESGVGGAFSFEREIALTDYNMLRWRLYVEDLDSDGFDDVLVTCYNFSPTIRAIAVDVLYGSVDGLVDASVLSSPSGGVSGVKVHDLDGDGMRDVLLQMYSIFGFPLRSTQLGIIRQVAPRVFEPTIEVQLETSHTFDVTDIDLDGVQDVVTPADGLAHVQVIFGVDEPCVADLNLDGALDFFDLSAFLGFYTDGRPIADFARDGVFDFFDLSAFLAAYAGGCP